jgi:hypothetical protein
VVSLRFWRCFGCGFLRLLVCRLRAGGFGVVLEDGSGSWVFDCFRSGYRHHSLDRLSLICFLHHCFRSILATIVSDLVGFNFFFRVGFCFLLGLVFCRSPVVIFGADPVAWVVQVMWW